MLLKSIQLTNFRQFTDATLTFAQGENGKNVTIVIGDNGSGKTTFAQAFLWCLYGETSFSDKNLLNKSIVEKAMREHKDCEAKVIVKLELQHALLHYTITCEQQYYVDRDGTVTADNVIRNMTKRNTDGNCVLLMSDNVTSEIQSILPEELSHYFFFDGERIEKMSKDIANRKKVDDFRDAVQGLLGLKGMSSAITHLKAVSRIYDKEYNTQSNQKIAEYSRTIEDCTERLNAIDARKEELESQIQKAKDLIQQHERDLYSYTDGAKLQTQKEALKNKLQVNLQKLHSTYNTMCTTSCRSFSSFITISLIHKALGMLAQQNFTGVNIPHLHQETIDYLLHQHECICGTKLIPDSVAMQTLLKLKEYLSPNSMSNLVYDFKKTSKARLVDFKTNDLYTKIKSQYQQLSETADAITTITHDISNLDQTLNGENVCAKVKTINAEIKHLNEQLLQYEQEREQLIFEEGKITQERDRNDTERRNLNNLDKANRQIQLYQNCAKQLYNELNADYQVQEEKIRKRLENDVNDIFQRIYQGGLYLTIDNKYRILVKANDYLGEVESSTAQSISVIFAFIAGIIKLARDNKNSTNVDEQLLSSELNPLVMDAPLSAFDKHRIQTVCATLPTIAHQIIIFIKDTDGDLAKEHLGNQIGKQYHLHKINELKTIVE